MTTTEHSLLFNDTDFTFTCKGNKHILTLIPESEQDSLDNSNHYCGHFIIPYPPIRKMEEEYKQHDTQTEYSVDYFSDSDD